MKIIFQNILLTKTTEAIQQEKEKDFHLFFSLPGKKSGYQPCTFLGQYAAFVIGAVAVGQVKQAQHTAHRPLPWIRRAIEHPADPAVENCSCTHHAGFQRHIQITSIQPPIADAAAGRFNGQHLRVGQSTMSSLAQIMAAAQHLPAPDHHCAYGDFSQPLRFSGLFQSQTHIPLVHGFSAHATLTKFWIIKKKMASSATIIATDEKYTPTFWPVRIQV